jgi:hypothetical protein
MGAFVALLPITTVAPIDSNGSISADRDSP